MAGQSVGMVTRRAAGRPRSSTSWSARPARALAAAAPACARPGCQPGLGIVAGTPPAAVPAARADGGRRRWRRRGGAARADAAGRRRAGGRGLHDLRACGPATCWSWRRRTGCNPDAVGRTRLRVGEGIVGIAAATGAVQNLPDAQNHPGLRLPARRPARTRSPPCWPCRSAAPGARWACWRCRTARRAAIATTRSRCWRRSPCCWPRCWPAPAPRTAPSRASAPPCRGSSTATPLAPGIAIGPVVLHGMRRAAAPAAGRRSGGRAGAAGPRAAPPCGRRSTT